MLFWLVTLRHKESGERDLNDPTWIVTTHGGTSKRELARQIEEAKESVTVSHEGPPRSEREEFDKELDVEIVEFNALGVARL